MRNLLRVILGVFTTSLSRTTDLLPLSTQNKSFAQKAIPSLRYITDFILLEQYQVHTTESIQSIKDYLGDFYQYKEVFHHFRANKAVKNLAKEATRELRSNQKFAASGPSSSSKRQNLTKNSELKKKNSWTKYWLKAPILTSPKCTWFHILLTK